MFVVITVIVAVPSTATTTALKPVLHCYNGFCIYKNFMDKFLCN